MNNYLCRAKRANNGQWVEGYYMKHQKRTPYPIGDTVNNEDFEHLILFSGFSDWGMPKTIQYVAIDPGTLCRTTGIKDTDGNIVWESDIVKIGDDEAGIVIWVEDSLSWGIDIGTRILPLGKFHSREIQIIHFDK